MNLSPPRLWEKGEPLDVAVHRFTVGDDPTWDRYLLHWDCLGTAAHARTLVRVGLLSEDELAALLGALAAADRRAQRGEFDIPPELEDGHTALEAELVRHCGIAGEKIHACRSRNDQVATALRLFLRHHTMLWLDDIADFIGTLLERIERDGTTPMPGYTHLQQAMPSSVGLWLHAHGEAALEQMRAAYDLLNRLDACPLHTGAGYGVPLALDRMYAAGLLGFSGIQRSPLDVQNSRGRMECYFARVGADVGGVVEKLASDLLLFCTAEFGFCALPEALSTGSSIMPNKHNPDVLELLRGGAARLRSRVTEIERVAGKLPSGYHRDLQLTKEPAIRVALATTQLLEMATRVIDGFLLRAERLAAAMRPELYAAHAALARAATGTPFRTAYREVAAEIRAGTFAPPELPQWRSTDGRLPADVLAAFRAEFVTLRDQARERREHVRAAEAALLPTDCVEE
ncbi:MAG: lyase family protein [Phycisphaerae bacterium]|jgi:argininosuccinate lyase